MHYHHHHDQIVCDDDHEWPEWAQALFATLFHIQGELMSQQDQINADVALLQDALTGIAAELQDFKAAAQAQAPELDLSGLDAIAAKARDLVPPTTAAATDAPATDVPSTDATPADTPAEDPAAVNPAPTL